MKIDELINRVRLERKFNGVLSDKLIFKIKECNCDSCKWYASIYFKQVKMKACRFIGIKEKYEIFEDGERLKVCAKYESKEK